VLALLDELWSGAAVSGAPSVEQELGLSHGAYAAFVFVGPQIVAAVLEGAVALLSDALDRRKLVAAGQLALAASLLAAGCARSAWTLTFALAVAGAASGIACGAGQALVVLEDDAGAHRGMIRWTLYASIGDVIAPLVTAAAIAAGFAYRGAMIAVALVVVVQGSSLLVFRGSDPPGAEKARRAEAEVTEVSGGMAALRRPGLWAWLFAAAMCTLLDELVVALAALRLHREQGVGEAFAAAAAVAFAVGSVVGAALSDGAVSSFTPRRVLVASAVACAGFCGVLVAVDRPAATCVALLCVGIAAAPHHALAQAFAYGELPERPGVVQAAGQAFVIVDVVAPLTLGLVADRFGLRAALGCLLAQPFIVLLCAVGTRNRPENLTEQ
jgi:MFS family permease